MPDIRPLSILVQAYRYPSNKSTVLTKILQGKYNVDKKGCVCVLIIQNTLSINKWQADQ